MRASFWGVLVLAACQGDTDSDTADQSDTGGDGASSFMGHDFLLESAEGFTPIPDVDIRLWFRVDDEFGPMVSASAGCNHMDGAVALEDDSLVIAGMGTTEMACGKALDAQESWFFGFVLSSPALSYEDPRLTLTGTDASLTFLDSEVATPDVDLAGALWTIDSLIDGEEFSTYNMESPPTLLFDEDGTVRIWDSCNEGQGSYTLTEDTITFSQMTSSYMDCSDETIVIVSEHFLSVVTEGETTFDIDASRVTLMRGSLGLSGTRDE
jgi:heat shock protein HslJ